MRGSCTAAAPRRLFCTCSRCARYGRWQGNGMPFMMTQGKNCEDKAQKKTALSNPPKIPSIMRRTQLQHESTLELR